MGRLSEYDTGLIRKRCRRENRPGHAHFLTFSCFQRRAFLSRDRARNWLAEVIELARERWRFDLWAYAFMPEHVHLILLPREEEYDISKILSTIKQSVAKRAVLFVRRERPEGAAVMMDRQPNGKCSLRFWQRGGGYDRNLYTVQEVWEKIRYVHGNPVERGLVKAAEDRVWSSEGDYAGVREGPLRIDWESAPR